MAEIKGRPVALQRLVKVRARQPSGMGMSGSLALSSVAWQSMASVGRRPSNRPSGVTPPLSVALTCS